MEWVRFIFGVVFTIVFLNVAYRIEEYVKSRREKIVMFEPYGHKRMMSEVKSILASMERTESGPSADEYLCGKIEQLLRSKRDEVKGWTEKTDYARIAHTLLYNFSFEALSSGLLHLTRGQLDPFQCGPHMVTICEMCMVWAKKNGYISSDEMYEALDALYDNIESVG